MAWDGPLERVDDYIWEIPKDYKGQNGDLKMRVPGRIYSDPSLIQAVVQDNAPEQVANVASLPGIVGHSLAMPDCHWGYGFPIGGVCATDAEEGVVSPGGVGFDINCGVRLMRTDLRYRDIKDDLDDLVEELFREVPSGLGSKGRVRLSKTDLHGPLDEGARWAVENDYGWERDTRVMEEYGRIDGADPGKVSDKALKRGAPQLGSLGSGNHFLEIQRVGKIYDADTAKVYGFEDEDQVAIMIHTGSRGFGHQVCTDYLKTFEDNLSKYGLDLVDKQLACGPVDAKETRDYLAAMRCAINFAFANRQMITHWTRNAFSRVLKADAEDMGMDLVYDVCHNIVKRETHEVDGEKRDLFVHRKGATRAFGPGRQEVPQTYRDIGQPVIVPGSMGTASYLLRGTTGAMGQTFGSSCHGAGRAMSRGKAKKTWRGEALIQELRNDQQIIVRSDSAVTAAEEAPGAYKDVEEVVHVTEGAGISDRIVQLKPLAVCKG